MAKHFMKIRAKKGDTLVEVALAIAILGAVVIGAVTIMTSTLGTSEYTLQETMARNEIDVQAEALRYVHNAYTAQISNTDSEKEYKHVWERITSYAVPPSQVKELNSINSCDEFYTDTDGSNGLYTTQGKSFIINTRALGTKYSKDSSMTNDIVLNSMPLAGVTSSSPFQLASVYPRVLYQSHPTEDATSMNDYITDVVTNNSALNLPDNDQINSVEGIWITAVCSDTNALGTECAASTDVEYYDFYIRTCWETTNEHPTSTMSSIIRLHNPDNAAVRLAMGTDQYDPVAAGREYTINYYDAYNGAWTRIDRISRSFTTNRDEVMLALPGKTWGSADDSRFFLGWCYFRDDSDIESNTGYGACADPMVAGSRIDITDTPTVNLYATYDPASMGYYALVHYIANGTGVTGMPRDETLTCDTIGCSTVTYTVPDGQPSRPNYAFTGWTDASGSSVRAGQRITLSADGSTYSLKANWRQTNTFTLSFDKNAGDDDVEGMPTTLSCTPSGSQCPIMVSGVIPRRLGYTFLGWTSQREGAVVESGVDRSAGMSFQQVMRGDRVLFAKWQYSNRYKVVFDKNAPSSAVVTGLPDERECEERSGQCVIQLTSADAPSRDGYIFLGWSTRSDGYPRWKPYEWAEGETHDVEVNYEIGAVRTLYAVWQKATLQSMNQQFCYSSLFDSGRRIALQDERDRKWYLVQRTQDLYGNDRACVIVQNMAYNRNTGSTRPGIAEYEGVHTDAKDYPETAEQSQGNYYLQGNINQVCPTGGWRVIDEEQTVRRPPDSGVRWGYYNSKENSSTPVKMGSGGWSIIWLNDGTFWGTGMTSAQAQNWQNGIYRDCSGLSDCGSTVGTSWNSTCGNYTYTGEQTTCNNFNAEWGPKRAANVRCMWTINVAVFDVNADADEEAVEFESGEFSIKKCTPGQDGSCTVQVPKSLSRDGYIFMGWAAEDETQPSSSLTEDDIVCEAGATCNVTLSPTLGLTRSFYAIWREDYMQNMDTRLCRSKYFDDGGAITMRDRRDNRYYAIVRDDSTNQCWMVQNLAYNRLASHVGNYVNPEVSGGDAAANSQGNYYAYSAVDTICPTGWTLPPGEDISEGYWVMEKLWGFYSTDDRRVVYEDQDALYWAKRRNGTYYVTVLTGAVDDSTIYADTGYYLVRCITP